MIEHLSSAYIWHCKRRAHYSTNSDCWHLQFHWQKKVYFKGATESRYLCILTSATTSIPG